MEESSHNPEPPAESESLPPGASSVEDKCPICLDDFKDKAFVTVCFHILPLHVYQFVFVS